MSDPIEAGREAIRESTGLDRPFVLSNFAATVIACAGLIGDSSATIIGAMLVATLVGPIMGIGLALVDADIRLLRRGLVALMAGAVMVLAISFLLGSAALESTPTQEMLSRTSPRLLDLIVALASGAIGAYAVTTRRLSAAIVGVSIAVALVPPLAAAGIFASRGQWILGQGALLLAFVNMVAIQVGASIALWCCGYRGVARGERGSLAALLRRQVLSLLLMVVLVASLTVHGLRLVREHRYEAGVRGALESALATRPDARLNEVTLAIRGAHVLVTAVVRSPARFTRDEVTAIRARLPTAPNGATPQLHLRHVEVDVETGGD